MVQEQPMADRIASLALARFRVRGFAGTSVADLATVLGVSKAAIYYHYRSKDALLHRLVDPLLETIDACIDTHSHPPEPAPTSTDAARQLLGAYLAVLTAHRDIVTWVATDVAVLNHPEIGPRIRAQNRRLRTLLAAPDLSVPATLRAEAALGAIWRPLVTEPDINLSHTPHQQTLIDAALATLDAGRSSSPRGSRPPNQSRRPATPPVGRQAQDRRRPGKDSVDPGASAPAHQPETADVDERGHRR
jgi:AcrR family transcriptional regulator